MDQKFLRDVQAAGWQIQEVQTDAAIAACPRPGCTLQVALRFGSKIPAACDATSGLPEIVVRTFEDFRVPVRERRERLGLTIRELEEVAGTATDHLAKAEKDNPARVPNIQLVLEWAASIGYEVILRPAPMPAMALRYLADSRGQLAARKKMQPHHRAKREGAGQSD